MVVVVVVWDRGWPSPSFPCHPFRGGSVQILSRLFIMPAPVLSQSHISFASPLKPAGLLKNLSSLPPSSSIIPSMRSRETMLAGSSRLKPSLWWIQPNRPQGPTSWLTWTACLLVVAHPQSSASKVLQEARLNGKKNRFHARTSQPLAFSGVHHVCSRRVSDWVNESFSSLHASFPPSPRSSIG